MKYTEIKKPVMVNIEISKDSNIKYEYDRKTNKLVVDRILRDGFYYPANYGFIPNTLDYDGDELDVLVYSPEKFLPGASLNVKIVGAMEMIDDGETDTKLLGVHSDDYRLNDINTLDDLPTDFLEKIQRFFSTYKNWKRIGITKVKDFKDQKWAMKEYQECLKLNDDFGHLTKKEFVEQMKKNYPHKYE